MIPTAKCVKRRYPVRRTGVSYSGTSPINIRKFNDHFKIDMLAPGLEIEDFEILVENDQLIVKTRGEQDDSKIKYLRREFDYSKVERSFHLGDKIDVSAINANLTNGILSIMLPIKNEKRKRKIDIV